MTYKIKEERLSADDINTLGNFCGKRDLTALTPEELKNRFGIEQADVFVLFGGSILSGGDVLAEAIKNRIAKRTVIVGGAGHTTDTLRQRVHKDYPNIETDGLSEAEVFSRYLDTIYGLRADYLEMKSTNCGNNITYLLELLEKEQIPFSSILLCQDATMQHRMEAGLRKYVDENTTIINYAAYQAKVVYEKEKLVYAEEIHGMWDMDRYMNLLMGEIPRLTDNEEGYGPNGKNFIAHVEVPVAVRKAFDQLEKVYGTETRKANPLYASHSDFA